MNSKDALILIKFKEDKQLLVKILDNLMEDIEFEIKTFTSLLKVNKKDIPLEKSINYLLDKVSSLTTFKTILLHDYYRPQVTREWGKVISATAKENLEKHIDNFYKLELPEELIIYIKNLGCSPIFNYRNMWVKEK